MNVQEGSSKGVHCGRGSRSRSAPLMMSLLLATAALAFFLCQPIWARAKEAVEFDEVASVQGGLVSTAMGVSSTAPTSTDRNATPTVNRDKTAKVDDTDTLSSAARGVGTCPCNADVNADGTTDSNDVFEITDCWTNNNCGGCINSCDVNCDGTIDSADSDAAQCRIDNPTQPPEFCCAQKCIPPGDDCFTTACDGRSFYSFASNPIPPDYFFPGSPAFSGSVQWGGPGAFPSDTTVRRLESVCFDCPLPESHTIQIEMTQLDLRSCTCIDVGGQLFRATVRLGGPSPGDMTITKDRPEGGTFSSNLNVNALIEFFPCSSPDGTPAVGQPIPANVIFSTTGPASWLQTDPGISFCNTPGFYAGFAINSLTGPCCYSTCHDNPNGDHPHCVIPPDCQPCPACDPASCDDGNDCTIDNCDPVTDVCTHTGIPCTTITDCPATATSCDPVAGICVCDPCPSTGCTKLAPAGNDCWSTDCGGTHIDFNDDPIPAGFFGPGSLPFDGTVFLRGATGGIDTQVARLQDMCFDGPLPLTQTIDIEIVQLDLVSCEPIIVQFQDGTSQLWSVSTSLTSPQPTGSSMTVTKDDPNGGTYDTTLNIGVDLTFSGPNPATPVLNRDILIESFGAPWAQAGGAGCGTGFHPGSDPNNPCCHETCHSSRGQAPHEHCVKPPDCQLCPQACCFDGGGCQDLAPDVCRSLDGSPRGDGTSCADLTICGFDLPCSDCGGSGAAHWIDTCPGGTDYMPTGAVVGIDTDLDCLVDQNLVMSGAAQVSRDPGSPHFINTEIVSMTLTGGGATLRAGAGGGVGATLLPSFGSIVEQDATGVLADSKFDVLFEIEVSPGVNLYNHGPLTIYGKIDCVPPDAVYTHFVGCLPLYDSPTPGTGAHVANLVSANHDTYPQPVCPVDLAFGDCTPRQEQDCQSGAAGDLCLPRAVQVLPSGFVPVECDCFGSDQGCGPIQAPTGGTTVGCPGLCPDGVNNCQIFADGNPTGQSTGQINDFAPGAVLTCDCPKPPPDPHITVQGTSATFGTLDVPPIPADFFYPGSDAFVGTVNLNGGPTNTLGQRSGPVVCPSICFDEFGSPVLPQVPCNVDADCAGIDPLWTCGFAPCDPVEVELVQLDLVSAAPITVQPNGSQWDVDVELSPATPPVGTMTIQKTHANGGTYDAGIPFIPVFTFTEVGNPTNQRSLDYDALGRIIEINFSGVDWVINVNPALGVLAPNDGNFVPGVREDIPGDPSSQVVIQALGNSKGGGISHPVQQPPRPPLPDPHITVDGTSATFGTPDVPPIPADFFFPGSPPFNGTVNLVGGLSNTLGQRSGPIVCPGGVGQPCNTVSVELVQLDLVSAAPITVGSTDWDVAVDLSPTGSPPLGTLDATLTHANGGTYDAHIPFSPRFIFTEVGNPGNFRVLDYTLESIAPIEINFFAANWVINVNPALPVVAPNDGNFVPGVLEVTPGDPTSQIVTQSNGLSKGGGIDHPVSQPPQPPLPDPHITQQGTSATFGSPDVPPIPADFFFPGSPAFVGPVNLVGGTTNTLGQRGGPIVCPGGVGQPCNTVSVELVQLDLVSAAPITVGTTDWDVAVDLSPTGSPPLGTLDATLAHANGGTYDAHIPFSPRFTFTEVGNPGNVRVLDYTLESIAPIEINFTGVDWVINVNPALGLLAPNDGDFVPGVREVVPGDPNSQVAIQSEGLSKGGGIDHPVAQPPQPPPPDPHVTVDGTSATFGSPDVPPIPPDFFFAGSPAFVGPVNLVGGTTNTLGQRSGPIVCPTAPAPGPCIPVAVELVQLDLVSAAPITVGTTSWDVAVDLSPTGTPPLGTLSATLTHANGGTYDAQIPFSPRFTFTEVGNPGNVRVLDYDLDGTAPIEINFFAANWVITVNPALGVLAPNDGNFVPGVLEVTPGDPTSQIVTQSNGLSKGGGIDHPVSQPPQFCPVDLAFGDCTPLQERDCQGSTAELCLPRVVEVGTTGVAVPFECTCFNQDAGCGPVQIGSGGDTISCPPTQCPTTGEECVLHTSDGQSTDRQSAPSADFIGQTLFCACATTGGPNPPVPVDPGTPNDRLKNRFISFKPNNPGVPVQLQVTLTASLPHPGLIGTSWWVQPPTAPGHPLLPAGECVALLGPQATAANIDWDASGCTILHVTGCPVEPTSDYDVQAVAGAATSAALSLRTILKPGIKHWADAVGFFNGTEWTPPNGTTNIDDAFACIKTWQAGAVVAPVGNAAHLSVADLEPGNINLVVNFNDVYLAVQAFTGATYPFGPADANGNCP